MAILVDLHLLVTQVFRFNRWFPILVILVLSTSHVVYPELSSSPIHSIEITITSLFFWSHPDLCLSKLQLSIDSLFSIECCSSMILYPQLSVDVFFVTWSCIKKRTWSTKCYHCYISIKVYKEYPKFSISINQSWVKLLNVVTEPLTYVSFPFFQIERG